MKGTAQRSWSREGLTDSEMDGVEDADQVHVDNGEVGWDCETVLVQLRAAEERVFALRIGEDLRPHVSRQQAILRA